MPTGGSPFDAGQIIEDPGSGDRGVIVFEDDDLCCVHVRWEDGDVTTEEDGRLFPPIIRLVEDK